MSDWIVACSRTGAKSDLDVPVSVGGFFSRPTADSTRDEAKNGMGKREREFWGEEGVKDPSEKNERGVSTRVLIVY